MITSKRDQDVSLLSSVIIPSVVFTVFGFLTYVFNVKKLTLLTGKTENIKEEDEGIHLFSVREIKNEISKRKKKVLVFRTQLPAFLRKEFEQIY